MKRREFILGLGGAAASVPLTGYAQQSVKSVIGYLGSGYAEDRRVSWPRRFWA